MCVLLFSLGLISVTSVPVLVDLPSVLVLSHSFHLLISLSSDLVNLLIAMWLRSDYGGFSFISIFEIG